MDVLTMVDWGNDGQSFGDTGVDWGDYLDGHW